MPPTITTAKLTLGYPIFAAVFLDANQLIVAGGGGEGRSGVGNKISLLDVSGSPSGNSDNNTHIKQLTELELSKDEDAPMSLGASAVRLAAVEKATPTRFPSKARKKKKKTGAATASSTEEALRSVTTILAGVNSSEASQKAGTNEHFRTFEVTSESITPISQYQLFTSSKEVENYQRVLRTMGELAALANGGGRSGFELVVISTKDYTVHRRISTNVEVSDLDLASDGSLAYCVGKQIFITSATAQSAPKELNWHDNTIKGTVRSVRFLTPRRLLAVLNYPSRTGSELFLLDATTGAIIHRRRLHHGCKAVTCLDAMVLSPQGDGVAAIAGANQSVEIVAIGSDRLKGAKTLHDLHPFQITKVAFSPPPPPSSTENQEARQQQHPAIRLATTSIGNTVVVITLPLIGTSGGGHQLLRAGSVARQTALSVLLSLIAVVVFAVLLQAVFVARGGLPMKMEHKWEDTTRMSNDVPGSLRGREGKDTGEETVDALLKGMKSGVATDPFNEAEAELDESELRNEYVDVEMD